jgi:hypothetical protein
LEYDSRAVWKTAILTDAMTESFPKYIRMPQTKYFMPSFQRQRKAHLVLRPLLTF